MTIPDNPMEAVLYRVEHPDEYLRDRNATLNASLDVLVEGIGSIKESLANPLFTFWDDPQAAQVVRQHAVLLGNVGAMLDSQFMLSRTLARKGIMDADAATQFAQELSDHALDPGELWGGPGAESGDVEPI